jgi:hypothetical protein
MAGGNPAKCKLSRAFQPSGNRTSKTRGFARPYARECRTSWVARINSLTPSLIVTPLPDLRAWGSQNKRGVRHEWDAVGSPFKFASIDQYNPSGPYSFKDSDIGFSRIYKDQLFAAGIQFWKHD